MKILVKKVEGVTLPQRGTDVSAGYDIVATSDPKIVGVSGKTIGGLTFWRNIDYIEYETNLFIAPSAVSFHTLIHPRSSVSKYNLLLANSVGLVDNDYRGMVICRFKYVWQPEDLGWIAPFTGAATNTPGVMTGQVNYGKIYKKGDKIAQLVVEPTVQVEWEFVDDLSQTQRGGGGFGSTDAIIPTTKDHTDSIVTAKHGVSPLIEKYREFSVEVPIPSTSYESAVKEREKSII